MISASVQTSTTDDRIMRAYLRQNSMWNLDDSGHMDHYGLSSSGNGDQFLNSSVHFPSEMRSANLHQMVSSIVDESGEYQQHGMMSSFVQQQADQHMRYVQQMRSLPRRPTKLNSSSLSESGYPRHIRDFCATQHHPPTHVQVLIRQVDHNGVNAVTTNVTLQQFRQMIGLQRSSRSPTLYERRNTRSNHNHAHQQPLSSSSSSSSLPPSNVRLINAFKQQENTMFNQPQFYSQPHSYHDANPTSQIAPSQEISYYRSNRRTGVANTLHIAIEKCYEQLNYIRDSYAETESKIGIQILHTSSATIVDTVNPNLSNNPSRVDRLIAEYHYEYSRITRLHERINESLSVQDAEATAQTLEEWHQTINTVQDRRRQEIDNAAERCRTGEPRLPDERDVLQLAESLRILRIITRKIRTILWYWLYWSTNSINNRIPLIARREEQVQHAESDNRFYSTSNISESSKLVSSKKLTVANDSIKENECSE